MKRLTATAIVAVLIMTLLTGCGKNRLLYKKVNLKNYVEVNDYLGIEIDTTTDSFAKIYDDIFNADVANYGLYKTTKNIVESGDTVTIDYMGKIDGVAFEGGTAKGADLEIGSNTFIDDFEEELIGVAVGETKDVTATFPNPYGNNPSLAGKEAIFTVTVNYINKVNLTEEEACEKMNFDTAEDYKADIKERAVKNYLYDTVCKKAKIKNYPEKDSYLLCDAIFNIYVDFYKNRYGVDFEEVLIDSGSSVKECKAQILAEEVPSDMNTSMVMYYIFDAEKLEILESALNDKDEVHPVISETYAVRDTVLQYLYDNAKIK